MDWFNNWTIGIDLVLVYQNILKIKTTSILFMIPTCQFFFILMTIRFMEKFLKIIFNI